jgi:hypothetical protein
MTDSQSTKHNGIRGRTTMVDTTVLVSDDTLVGVLTHGNGAEIQVDFCALRIQGGLGVGEVEALRILDDFLTRAMTAVAEAQTRLAERDAAVPALPGMAAK